MTDVFISYSHEDRDFATRLRSALLARDKSVWMDEEDIPPASRWASDLAAAIEEASAFVFIISPDSAASAECRKELDHAAALNKRLIPVHHRETPVDDMPAVLASHNFIPARGPFDAAFDASLALLVSAIDTDLDWVREHTAWGSKALEWGSHGRDRSFLLSGTELSAAETFLANSPGREPQPTQLQNNYVIASRQASTRRQRRLLAGVSTALIVAIVLGIVALIQRADAVANYNRALSGQYAALAEKNLRSDPEVSMQLSLGGLDVTRTQPAEAALRDSLPAVQVLHQVTAPHRTPINTAALSADGSQLVTTHADTARVWNAATGKPGIIVTEPGGEPITSASFSPNGQEIATSSQDGTARLWSATTGAPIGVLGHQGDAGLYRVAWSPNGRYLVTAGNDGYARVWTHAGVQIDPLGDYDGTPVYDAEFNATGSEIVAATRSGHAIIYSRRPADRLNTGGSAITSAAFNPGGNEIVTADGDGTAKIWSVPSNKLKTTLGSVGAAVIVNVAFSPDGSEVVTAGHEGIVEIWDVVSGRRLLSLTGHTGNVNTALFSRTGGEVVTAGEDGTARIWDAAPREARTIVRQPSGTALLSASFDASGSLLATAGTDGTVRVWRAGSGGEVSHWSEPSGQTADTVAFNPAGTELLVAGADGSARIIQASSGREIGPPISADASAVLDASWSPDSRKLVTAGEDGDAWIWSATGTRLDKLPSDGGVVFSAVFSPDGRDVLTADRSGHARIWSVASGQPVGAALASKGNPEMLTAAYNRAGNEIVTVTGDGDARVWSVASRSQIGATLSHPGGAFISNATFNPAGTEVVTAADDGTARIWALPSGKPLTTLGEQGGPSVVSAIFNPQGSQVATVDLGGRGILWSTQLAAPLSDLERIAGQRVTVPLTAAQKQAFLAGAAG